MEHKGEPLLRRCVTATTCLVFLYPLSFGPAYWAKKYWSINSVTSPAWNQAFRTTYHPIVMLATRNSLVAKWASWYLRLGVNDRSRISFKNDSIWLNE